MFEDYTFKADWQQCKSLASLAEKHPPMKKPREKELLTEYYSYKRLWYTTRVEKGKEKIVVNIEDLPNLTIHDRRRQQAIKDEMIIRNLRIIIRNCKLPQFLDKGIPLVELIHEGILGYIYCLDHKFDLSRGNRFNTVAINWVKQYVGRAIENKSSVVRLPLHVRAQISKIRSIYREYIKNNGGEPPTPEEISVRLLERYGDRLTPLEVEELGRLQYCASSLDESGSEEGQASLVDFITTNGEEEILDEVERNANKDYVHKIIGLLDKDEAKLIIWKYGLIDHNSQRSSLEMAKILGVTKNEYMKFEKATMLKLKGLMSREAVNL